MQLSAVIPISIFGIVAATVGVRLLLLWWQTRQLPELTMGMGMVILSLVSVPLSALGRSPQLAATPVGRWAFIVGMGATVTAFSLHWLFQWRVYRPKERWAAVLFAVATGLLLLCLAGTARSELMGRDLPDIVSRARPWLTALMAMMGLTYFWGGAEALLYHRTLRRRLSIGLADPVLVNRFLLWGVANVTITLMAAGLTGAILNGILIGRDPRALSAVAASGVMMSTTYWLTFFAPERYRRWVRERAERASAARDSSGPA